MPETKIFRVARMGHHRYPTGKPDSDHLWWFVRRHWNSLL